MNHCFWFLSCNFKMFWIFTLKVKTLECCVDQACPNRCQLRKKKVSSKMVEVKKKSLNFQFPRLETFFGFEVSVFSAVCLLVSSSSFKWSDGLTLLFCLPAVRNRVIAVGIAKGKRAVTVQEHYHWNSGYIQVPEWWTHSSTSFCQENSLSHCVAHSAVEGRPWETFFHGTCFLCNFFPFHHEVMCVPNKLAHRDHLSFCKIVCCSAPRPAQRPPQRRPGPAAYGWVPGPKAKAPRPS